MARDKRRLMKTTQYLYGIEPEELDNKYYFPALKHKVETGKKLYKYIHNIENKTKEESDREFWVLDALNHTRKLIKEREECE